MKNNHDFNQSNPWAVSLYDGERHLSTEQAANYSWANCESHRARLKPGMVAVLMKYEGGRWKRVQRREKVKGSPKAAPVKKPVIVQLGLPGLGASSR